MKITPLAIDGVRLVEIERLADERGYFARLWCRQAFADAGLAFTVEQTSASYNDRAGTVRGLHFAWPPAREFKLVRCTRGRLHDVLLDLRPDSSSFGRHQAVQLDPDTHDTLVVPPGVAHGFQTLLDATEVHYMMSEAYRPDCLGGVRFDDPAFGISWPLPVSCVSPRDAAYAGFDAPGHTRRWRAAEQAAAALLPPTQGATHAA
jgi:dTDP-4-dehydrorhamnose 3,5-epimerase